MFVAFFKGVTSQQIVLAGQTVQVWFSATDHSALAMIAEQVQDRYNLLKVCHGLQDGGWLLDLGGNLIPPHTNLS